ncbi:DUF4179 domain-containing protein [uncultured Ruthenibacterium sp.]|uniref:DUF4179 domain-containing protein n=1 Tax=uncultured Ruthenibacterium sp. TaxID=1905347 RepID=UPI00349ED917
MKTWFEWMDEYYEPFVQEISDEKKLEPLKKRVMENLHESKEKTLCSEKRFGRFRGWGIVAAAIAMVCCLGVGAMAATAFPWDGVFGKYFGSGAQDQADALGISGEGMNLVSTNSGCTLTLNGALFDGEKLYLPLTISFEEVNPDPNLMYYVFGKADKGNSAGSRMLQDENPNDKEVNLMCTLSGPEIKSGEPITWDIFELYANCSDENGNTKVVWEKEGQWNFTFTVPQSQQVHEMEVTQEAADPVTGVPIAQIRLTSMRISVVFDGLPEDSSIRDTLSDAEIVLHLDDGSTRVLGTWEDGVREAQGAIDENVSPIGRAYYELSCEYGDFIDPMRIIAVDINGCNVAKS